MLVLTAKPGQNFALRTADGEILIRPVRHGGEGIRFYFEELPDAVRAEVVDTRPGHERRMCPRECRPGSPGR